MDDELKKVYSETPEETNVKLTNAQNFWELFKESTIMQAVLSFMVVAAYIYMLLAGLYIPTGFDLVVGVVIGFFFGGKLGVAQGKLAEKNRAASEEE
jgi:hypothetical protein